MTPRTRRQRTNSLIPGDARTQTLIRLALDTATEEWWAYRQPIIAWMLAEEPDTEVLPSLLPFVWSVDCGLAIAIRDDHVDNATWLYGLYGADEVPEASDLEQAAKNVRRKLDKAAATRAARG
jgi:hypothetical protein